MTIWRSSPPEVFLGKGILEICTKFTGEHPCRSAISVKLLCNFIEIALCHGCSINLQCIFRTSLPDNTSEELLLQFAGYIPLQMNTNEIFNSVYWEIILINSHINIDSFSYSIRITAWKVSQCGKIRTRKNTLFGHCPRIRMQIDHTFHDMYWICPVQWCYDQDD